MADDPATGILDATYRALCEHGSTNLTRQGIAAKADKNPASIHDHHDAKDQLFVAFLNELYERFTDSMDPPTDEAPHEQRDTPDQVLLTPDADLSLNAFRPRMLERGAQTPSTPTLRVRLREFDESRFETLREVLAAGVDAGEFDSTIEPVNIAEDLSQPGVAQ